MNFKILILRIFRFPQIIPRISENAWVAFRGLARDVLKISRITDRRSNFADYNPPQDDPFGRERFAAPVSEERFRLIEEWLRFLPFQEAASLSRWDLDSMPSGRGEAVPPDDLRRRTKSYDNRTSLTACVAIVGSDLFIEPSGFATTMDDLVAHGLVKTSPRMLARGGENRKEIHIDAREPRQFTGELLEQPGPLDRDVVHRPQGCEFTPQFADTLEKSVQLDPTGCEGIEIPLQQGQDFVRPLFAYARARQRAGLNLVYVARDFVVGFSRDLLCAGDLFVHTWLLSTTSTLTWSNWGLETPSLVAYPVARRRQTALLRAWLCHLTPRAVLTMSVADLLMARSQPSGLAVIGREGVRVPRTLVRATLQNYRAERRRIRRVADSLFIFVGPDGSPTRMSEYRIWKMKRSMRAVLQMMLRTIRWNERLARERRTAEGPQRQP